MSTKGFLALLIASFMFGTWGILSRYLGQNLDLFFQFWTRYLFLSFIIFIALVWTKQWKSIQKSKIPWFIIRVFFGFISILFLYIAFNSIPIGTAYFATYAGTIIGGFVIGSLFFREKMQILKVTSLVLSLIGLYIIYSFDFDPTKVVFLLLAFVSGLSYSIWYSCSKIISDQYSILQITFIDYFIGFFFALIPSIFLKETWVLPSLTFPWFVNLVFAATSITTGILLIYGFKKVEVQKGTLILLTEVVFGIILAYLFFKEVITISSLIGGGMILLGSGLSLLSKTK